MTSYDETLDALHGLETFGMRLGLESARRACAELGHPETAFPTIHIAGTNGKGTTALAVEALARAHGRRVGCYLSPHLVDIRERIRVDGRPVGAADVVAGWDRVAALGPEPRTYFEALTLIAFDRFAAHGVELGVVEVGLGGRLDATNVVTPRLAVVTGIGLDHERHLGTDLASIAREKAGIFKPGRPALVGSELAPAVQSSFVEAAREVGAELAFLDDEVEWRTLRIEPDGTWLDYRSPQSRLTDLFVPLPGRHYAADVALALRAWERAGEGSLDEMAARRALAGLAPAGRMERLDDDGVPVLLDVAHNPAAIGRLIEVLRSVAPGPSAFVAGILADKAWPGMLDRMAPAASGVWLCRLAGARPERRLERPDVEPELDARPWAEWTDSVREGLSAARRAVLAGRARRVVVTGSFYTVGDALVALGAATPGEPYEPAARGPVAILRA